MNYICYRIVLFLFLILVNSQHISAQYEDLHTALKLPNKTDRYRVFSGYIDQHNVKGEALISFLDYFEKKYRSENDLDMCKAIEFLRLKEKAITSLGDNSYNQKINALLKLITRYEDEGEYLFVGNCYRAIAFIQFEKENYGLAFENNFRALDLYEKIGFEHVPEIVKFLHEIALKHFYFKDYKEVVSLMHKAIKLPKYNDVIEIQCYNNLGLAYSRLQDRDSAIFYLNKTYELADKYKSDPWKAIASGNIGTIYYDLKEYDKAYEHYKKLYQYGKDQPDHIIRLTSYVYMSKAYLKLDSIALAKEYIQKVDFSLKQLADELFQKDTQQIEVLRTRHLENKENYFKQINDFKSALEVGDSLNKITQSLNDKYNTAQIKIAADRLSLQEHQLKIIENEKKRAKQRLSFVKIVLILLLIGGGIYFNLYRSKVNRKRQNEKLLAENRISILEKQQLERELKVAKSHISNYVSKINQQNNLVQKFENELEKLKEAHQIQGSDGDGIGNFKTIKILTDKDWQDFQENFEKAYPRLMYGIKQHLPAFTVSEMRYLMLTCLGLKNKEMARAIGVSDGAIRVTLSRVRKKMNNLPEEVTPENIKEALEQNNLEETYLN